MQFLPRYTDGPTLDPDRAVDYASHLKFVSVDLQERSLVFCGQFLLLLTSTRAFTPVQGRSNDSTCPKQHFPPECQSSKAYQYFKLALACHDALLSKQGHSAFA